MVPDNYIKRVIQFAKQGYKDMQFDTVYDTDWDSARPISPSPARTPTTPSRSRTISCAPSRRTATGTLSRRKDGKKIEDAEVPAISGRRSATPPGPRADPGLHFNTTMNDWHTCPASGGPIRASNPCSEYMFLDDTACNLASLNLLQFYDPSRPSSSTSQLTSTPCRLWTVVLEISVLMAQFPSKADRGTVLRVPHAGPRLRQYRRPA